MKQIEEETSSKARASAAIERFKSLCDRNSTLRSCAKFSSHNSDVDIDVSNEPATSPPVCGNFKDLSGIWAGNRLSRLMLICISNLFTDYQILVYKHVIAIATTVST